MSSILLPSFGAPKDPLGHLKTPGPPKDPFGLSPAGLSPSAYRLRLIACGLIPFASRLPYKQLMACEDKHTIETPSRWQSCHGPSPCLVPSPSGDRRGSFRRGGYTGAQGAGTLLTHGSGSERRVHRAGLDGHSSTQKRFADYDGVETS